MPIKDLPVYHTLAEVEQAMRLALRDEAEDDDDEHEMYGRDYVLAGLVAFLAERWPEREKEQILRLLDVYCAGNPVVIDADLPKRFVSILAPYWNA